MKKIRVAICDDQKTICQYYKNVIECTENMETVGIAYDSLECLKLVEEVKPDILLLDLQLEYHEAGFDIVPKLKELSPSTKILMLTMHSQYTNLLNAMSLKIDFFLDKNCSEEKLLHCINSLSQPQSSDMQDIINRELIEGGLRLAQENKSLLYTLTLLHHLTKAELEILSDLCDNLNYKQISEKRFVTENTIRSQIVHIVRKTEAQNIKELVKTLKDFNVFMLFNINE